MCGREAFTAIPKSSPISQRSMTCCLRAGAAGIGSKWARRCAKRKKPTARKDKKKAAAELQLRSGRGG